MKKSFYHFLMKYRHSESKDELSNFAQSVYEDHGFPKHSVDYHEISNYFELHVDYLPTLTIFDHAWELYMEAENK